MVERSIEALIVAHGLPSDPAGQEAGIAALADQVSAHLDAITVGGTTLAMPGGLEAAVGRARGRLVVYPLFMADGWFVSDELPRRLARARAGDARVLTPFGLDPAVHRLALARAMDAATEPARTTLLVAAHGSPSDPRAAEAARRAASVLGEGGFRAIRFGFIDEAPYLADAARDLGRAVCLPYFARRAGHVTTDLPRALEAAGFTGTVLDPIGEDPETPSIIARAIAEALA